MVQTSDSGSLSILSGRTIDDHEATLGVNEQAEYALTDALGSTVATTDQTGALKSRFTYEPFGQASVFGQRYLFQFTGRVPARANLDYFRARFYNAVLARFISEDPIDEMSDLAGPRSSPSIITSHTKASKALGKDTTSYTYAMNSPTKMVDPDGLTAIDWFQPKCAMFFYYWYKCQRSALTCKKQLPCFAEDFSSQYGYESDRNYDMCVKKNPDCRNMLETAIFCGYSEGGARVR